MINGFVSQAQASVARGFIPVGPRSGPLDLPDTPGRQVLGAAARPSGDKSPRHRGLVGGADTLVSVTVTAMVGKLAVVQRLLVARRVQVGHVGVDHAAGRLWIFGQRQHLLDIQMGAVAVGLRLDIAFGPGRQGADVQRGEKASGVDGFGVHGGVLDSFNGGFLPRPAVAPRWKPLNALEVSRLYRAHWLFASLCIRCAPDTLQYKPSRAGPAGACRLTTTKRREGLDTMDHVDHVLIVDDDREIRELVGNYLKKNGLRTTVVADGRQMRAFLETTPVDLIVLDIMMPGDDGLVLCRELRAGKHKATPVLMLTARNDETDRIIGLEMGADDYLVKPFAARELLARINAVLRRTRMLPPNLVVTESGRLLAFGRWRLDTTARHLLDSDGTMVALSGAEYRLLRVFLDHPQRVLNRDQLLNLTQGRDADLFDRSIDLLVSRLRQRLLDDAREPAYIKTVRSEGYVFSLPVEILEASV